MKNKRWTEEEIKILKESWGFTPTNEIAATLERPKNSIQTKAYKLGLKIPDENYTKVTGRHKWTFKEETFLNKNYRKYSLKELSVLMNIDEKVICRKAYAMNLQKQKGKLTERDINYLESHWGICSANKIAEMLRVTVATVNKYARKLDLGDQVSARGERMSSVEISMIMGVELRKVSHWLHAGYLEGKKFRVGTSNRIRYQVTSYKLKKFLKEYQDKYMATDINLEYLLSFLEMKSAPEFLKQKLKEDKKIKKVIKPKKIIKPWSTLEVKKMMDLKAEGYKAEYIAKRLGRSRGSIYAKYEKLNK